MINLLLAIAPTFIIWLVTLLTTGTSLPTYMLYMLFGISYLVLKEIKYDMGDK